MKIKYLTLFDNFYNEFLNTSIIKKAIERKLVEAEVIDLKKEVTNKRVDSKIVGGGKGNLLRYDVVSDTLKKYKSKDSKVILVTPKGTLYNQQLAKQLAKEEELIFVCPHFEGIDERIVDEVDYCISIGDYILTGGELASQVISDSVIRLLEDVINKDSLKEETFEEHLLESGQYTLPRVYNNKQIPQIYFSGNHKAIKEYRLKESLLITKKNRPDLYKKHKLSDLEKKVLKKCNKKWEKEIVDNVKK